MNINESSLFELVGRLVVENNELKKQLERVNGIHAETLKAAVADSVAREAALQE